MDFAFTPEEAVSTAKAVVAHLTADAHTVVVETEVDADVQFRPTMSAVKDGLDVYVEAQSAPAYTAGVKELVSWVSVKRRYCEVFIAIPVDASPSGRFLSNLVRDGVGLMFVGDQDAVSVHRKALNPALVVTPDPTLRLGRRSADVREAVRNFNEVDRKGALQTMCEIVESETDKLVRRLAKRAWINKSEAAVVAMDWSTQINVSAANDVYVAGRSPVVDDKLKTDLQSFRGARNLMDHKVRSKVQERKRQQQYAERMLMGPRLVADLLSVQRKVL